MGDGRAESAPQPDRRGEIAELKIETFCKHTAESNSYFEVRSAIDENLQVD